MIQSLCSLREFSSSFVIRQCGFFCLRLSDSCSGAGADLSISESDIDPRVSKYFGAWPWAGASHVTERV